MSKITKPITAVDFRSHHINHRPYASDMEYVRVAKQLQKLITLLSGGEYINKEVSKDLAIRLTLHLEDTVADAGVWRGFCMGHKRLYGTYMPFQWGECEVPLDEVSIQSCSFIIWMTLTNYDNMRYANPLMPAVDALGKVVYGYLDGVFDDITINEDMLDDMYSERVLGNFYKMRDVLSWLSDPEGCYMSFSNVTAEGYAQETEAYYRHLSQLGAHVNYHIRSTMPFKEKGGPLATLPQEWYADMLVSHEDGSVRKCAEWVRGIRFKDFDMYMVEAADEESVALRCLDKEEIKVCFADFGIDWSEFDEDANLVIGAFAWYKDCWHATGISSFQHFNGSFDDEIRKHLDSVESHKCVIGIYQKVIDKNNGQRLYYFHSFDDLKAWHDDIAKTKDRDKLFDKFPDHIRESKELLVYLPTDGGMELARELCASICDDNNPFYDAAISEQESMYVLDTDALRGECVRYIIGHGGFRNLSFAGDPPTESHAMAQANLDFLARYYRRSMY